MVQFDYALVNSAFTTLAVFFVDTREIFCNNGMASRISKLRSGDIVMHESLLKY